MFALAKYPTMENLNLAGNTFADELADGLKMEILIEVPELEGLKMLGEEEVTVDEVTEAKETRAKRKQEAEEEAARLAEEAKAAEN